MAEPTILGVREILRHFRATVQMARQTGEPVIIALRHRTPAAVILGYETWQAQRQEQSPDQADTVRLPAELAAEKLHYGELTAELQAVRQQAETLRQELAAARQRVAELEAQVAERRSWGQTGSGWGVTPTTQPQTRQYQTWGGSTDESPVAKTGWGR